ncbi:hypothetical protein NY588_14395 [Curtobacterium flaccumfaciens pv. beticola]|uniref:hypothetical protein n=1 Tax=Curtobacterium flaccumfaciens TaxID=2035 RepID=UPI00349F6D86|nr:hypothetical protein [Curtobacterium flaccumfaciens pv. basellae]
MNVLRFLTILSALGGLGVLLLIVDDVWRFAFASPYLGPVSAVIGSIARAALLITAVIAWRRDRRIVWVNGVLLLTMLGRVAVSVESAAPYWFVTAAHLAAPVAAALVGVRVARRARGLVRGLGLAIVAGGVCWLLAS